MLLDNELCCYKHSKIATVTHFSTHIFVAIIADKEPKELTSHDLGQLSNILSEAVAKWHELGLQLGISVGRLREIEEDHKTARRRFTEVLNDWVKGTNPSTVGNLEAALRSESVKEHKLADDVIRLFR